MSPLESSAAHHLAANDAITPATPSTNSAFVHESFDGVNVVHVYGEIDLNSADEFDAAIYVAARLEESVIIDLEPCQFADSSILTALVRAHDRLRSRLLIIVPQTGPVRRLFTITSLLQHLPVFDSIDGALASRNGAPDTHE